MASEVGDGRGRSEGRYVTAVVYPEGLPDEWADVGAVTLVCQERAANGKPNESTPVTTPPVCGSGRRSSPGTSAATGAWRTGSIGAWTSHSERTIAGRARANLGMIRRVALSLHRTDTKGSIRTRRMKEAWGDNYLLTARKILTTK